MRAALSWVQVGYSLLLALALTLLLSLGVLGIVGGLVPSLDLVNHFRPWWILAGLIGLLALWPARRGWRLPLASLAGLSLLLQAPFVLPTAFAAVSDEEQLGQPLTLISLNMRYANRDVAPAVDFLAESKPDLVFLQEVSASHLEALKERLSPDLPYGVHCVGGRYCNLVILSRFPLEEEAASYLGWRETPPPTPPTDPAWRKAPELPRDRGAAAGLLAEAVLAEGQRLSLFTIHLSWPYPAEIQRRQFRWIARHLEALPEARTILAGDFNSTPWSFGLRGFDVSIQLKRVTQGVFSFPTGGVLPLPLLPIDQVYLGSSFSVEQVSRGPDVGSDHYPIITSLRYRP